MKAKWQTGVSLVELIVFIVVAGIAVVGLMKMLSRSLPTAPTAQQITQATQLAQERMELILGQKDNVGYAGMTDPCVGGTPPGICVTAGFTVAVTGISSVVACPAAIDPSTANCKSITVTVTGTSGSQLVRLTSLVTNL